jgi:hypothetical protein
MQMYSIQKHKIVRSHSGNAESSNDECTRVHARTQTQTQTHIELPFKVYNNTEDVYSLSIGHGFDSFPVSAQVSTSSEWMHVNLKFALYKRRVNCSPNYLFTVHKISATIGLLC